MDGRDTYPGAPLWLKVGGIILIVALVALAGAFAFGGGSHGPGRHAGMMGDHGDASPVAEGALHIEVTAADLRFTPAEIRVAAGTDVAIVLTSTDTVHDFTIDELDAHVGADRGETATGGFHAGEPGQYTYYCSVPGHRGAGMEGTLVVEEPAGGGA